MRSSLPRPSAIVGNYFGGVDEGGSIRRAATAFDVLDAARRDPEALVAGNEQITLDEVQLGWRAPWWRVI